MDALSILKDDHQQILSLFVKLLSGKDQDLKKSYFQQLVLLLTLHMQCEEEILYPMLKEISQLTDVVSKSLEVHHLVNLALKELKTLPIKSATWLPKLRTIKDVMVMHMQEEEYVIFPRVEEFLSESVMITLRDNIQQFKQGRDATQGMPLDPSSQFTG